MIDLAVVGGGPAGLATAITGALAGLDVCIIEPKAGVIDKACGEGLMPPAVATLGELGVALRGHPFLGIRYLAVGSSRVAEASFPGGPGLGVRRLVLHEALRSRAEALGVKFIEGRVAQLRQSSDSVDLGFVSARYAAVADGLQSPLRRALGLLRPARHPQRLGVRRHFHVAKVEPWVEVHWATDAEAYVTPVNEDTVGVAILYTRGTQEPDGQMPFERWLDRFPDLRARLGEPASSARGAGPFEQRVAARVAGRVMLVGDAAGYLDPITGEGIRLGLEAAGALVAAVKAGRPTEYEAAWRRVTRRYYWMTGGLLMLARHRWTRGLIVPVVARAPWVMRGVLGLLASE